MTGNGIDGDSVSNNGIRVNSFANVFGGNALKEFDLERFCVNQIHWELAQKIHKHQWKII